MPHSRDSVAGAPADASLFGGKRRAGVTVTNPALGSTWVLSKRSTGGGEVLAPARLKARVRTDASLPRLCRGGPSGRSAFRMQEAGRSDCYESGLRLHLGSV